MPTQAKADAAKAQLARYIDEQIETRPIEARIVRRVITAMANAGHPVVAVDDRDEVVDVTTERDILEQVFNLDECFLLAANGAWVRLTMGEEWDIVCDHSVSLEDALAPVYQYIDRHN